MLFVLLSRKIVIDDEYFAWYIEIVIYFKTLIA